MGLLFLSLGLMLLAIIGFCICSYLHSDVRTIVDPLCGFILIVGVLLFIPTLVMHVDRETDYNEAIIMTETYQLIMDNIEDYKSNPEVCVKVLNDTRVWNEHILHAREKSKSN